MEVVLVGVLFEVVEFIVDFDGWCGGVEDEEWIGFCGDDEVFGVVDDVVVVDLG